jgi:hypothetical protein
MYTPGNNAWYSCTYRRLLQHLPFILRGGCHSLDLKDATYLGQDPAGR